MIESETTEEIFSQLHIDVARNATDDFNLFHHSKKWSRIHRNPFNGPIVLGFQLEQLVEHRVSIYRQSQNESAFIAEKNLRFSNYQFTFVNAVKPGQTISVEIKPTQFKDGANAELSNRIAVKADNTLALLGFKKETQFPLFLPDADLPQTLALRHHPDRTYLVESPFFLKRKFFNVSNAKNFLCGSLVDQDRYFDDLMEKAIFSDIFPSSLISCALLERAFLEKLDFEKNPMVYLSHKISVDQLILSQLRSNDVLHILVKEVVADANLESKGGKIIESWSYECYGIVKESSVLYRALISVAPINNP